MAVLLLKLYCGILNFLFETTMTNTIFVFGKRCQKTNNQTNKQTHTSVLGVCEEISIFGGVLLPSQIEFLPFYLPLTSPSWGPSFSATQRMLLC